MNRSNFKNRNFNKNNNFNIVVRKNNLDDSSSKEFFNKIMGGNIKEIEYFLLNNIISINYSNKDGKNALHLIIQSNFDDNNKIAIMNLLINKGININHIDKNNNSPLLLCCIECKYDLIDFLLNFDVDINVKNNYNLTPLHYLSKGYITKCSLLKKPPKMIDDSNSFTDNINLSKINKILFNKIKEKIKIKISEFNGISKNLFKESVTVEIDNIKNFLKEKQDDFKKKNDLLIKLNNNLNIGTENDIILDANVLKLLENGEYDNNFLLKKSGYIYNIDNIPDLLSEKRLTSSVIFNTFLQNNQMKDYQLLLNKKQNILHIILDLNEKIYKDYKNNEESIKKFLINLKKEMSDVNADYLNPDEFRDMVDSKLNESIYDIPIWNELHNNKSNFNNSLARQSLIDYLVRVNFALVNKMYVVDDKIREKILFSDLNDRTNKRSVLDIFTIIFIKLIIEKHTKLLSSNIKDLYNDNDAKSLYSLFNYEGLDYNQLRERIFLYYRINVIGIAFKLGHPDSDHLSFDFENKEDNPHYDFGNLVYNYLDFIQMNIKINNEIKSEDIYKGHDVNTYINLVNNEIFNIYSDEYFKLWVTDDNTNDNMADKVTEYLFNIPHNYFLDFDTNRLNFLYITELRNPYCIYNLKKINSK